MQKRYNVIVSGRVQGVSFRWFVARTAERLGVKGWVRNNYDGSVESVVEGEESSVMQFIAEIRRGPSSAMVTDLEISEETPKSEFDSFNIVH